jgi:hypothetical protein
MVFMLPALNFVYRSERPGSALPPVPRRLPRDLGERVEDVLDEVVVVARPPLVLRDVRPVDVHLDPSAGASPMGH